MKERKIVQAVKSLSAIEMNDFRKFMKSPFFNQNEKCLAYFELLYATLKEGRDPATLTGEEIWAKTFGELAFEDLKLRKLSSDMFGLYEEFTMQKQLESEKVLKQYLRLRAYKEKGLRGIFNSASSELELLKKINPNKSSEYYLNQYNVEKLLLEFNLQGDIVAKNANLDQFVNLDEISLNLDVFFIAEKLKYYCNLLSWNRSFNVSKKLVGVDIILKLARSPIFKDYPPISIYYTISLTLTDEQNEEHYYKLRFLIDEFLHLFSRDEAKEILESALGYCVTRSNKGILKFEKEALDLYKKSIKENLIFLNDGSLSPREFRNITALALKIGEYTWAEEFIQEYALFIEESVRESNVNFSLARVEWYKKDYNKVIQLLAFTDYTEVFQAILSRTLLLLSYFELNELESLESLLNSFKLFLDREKTWTKQRKLQYYNLIKYCKSLIKLSMKDMDKLQRLLTEVNITDPIVNKQWLIEKINEKLNKKLGSS
jgi:hypothetical protein